MELCKQNHYIIAHFHWFYIYQLNPLAELNWNDKHK